MHSPGHQPTPCTLAINAHAGFQLTSLPLCPNLTRTTTWLLPQCGSHHFKAWLPPRHRMPVPPMCSTFKMLRHAKECLHRASLHPQRYPCRIAPIPLPLYPKPTPSSTRLTHVHMRLLHAPSQYTGPSHSQSPKTLPTLHAFPAHDSGNSMPKPTYSPVHLHLTSLQYPKLAPTPAMLPPGQGSLQQTGCCLLCDMLCLDNSKGSMENRKQS
jgi:hypothetical protein